MSQDFLTAFNFPAIVVGVALLWWRMGRIEREHEKATEKLAERLRLVGKAILLLSSGDLPGARDIVHGKEF